MICKGFGCNLFVVEEGFVEEACVGEVCRGVWVRFRR